MKFGGRGYVVRTSRRCAALGGRREREGRAPWGWQTPETWSKPSIVLLDVGMSTQLTEGERHRMVDLFRAFSRLDGGAMARVTLRFSAHQSCSNPEVPP